MRERASIARLKGLKKPFLRGASPADSHIKKTQRIIPLRFYYMLSLITIIFKEENSELSKYPISRLAFYKGRKGEIEYIDVKDIGSKNIISALKKLDKLWNLKLNDELYKSLEEYIENLNAIEYKSKDIK